MSDYYYCFSCTKVTPLFTVAYICSTCGGLDGEKLSQEQFAEELKAGGFNSDTGSGIGRSGNPNEIPKFN